MNTIPFARLTLVEWRKQLDTRSGRWLLISIALLIAAVLAVMAFIGDVATTFPALFFGTSTPLSILLPVVGILAATSEWSQRTGLITFTLEPRRTRVGLAKLTSALGSGVVFFALAVGLAAAFHVAVVAFTDAGFAWDLPAGALWGGLLLTVLWMAQGVAFGALIQNSAGAIVAFFGLPVALALFGPMVPALRDAMPWIDLSTATEPVMYDAAALTGNQWAHLGTAITIWVLLPLVLGLVRVARSEIKSA
ncbi:ABC transporter permease [Myceligenerans crystallogenes]|uniref:ABC-2 type transport system permease protein n=1 Tax=Myceligenerans crystallogenes TaxID=316335 RepID=A0ABN2N420_9MICO